MKLTCVLMGCEPSLTLALRIVLVIASKINTWQRLRPRNGRQNSGSRLHVFASYLCSADSYFLTVHGYIMCLPNSSLLPIALPPAVVAK